jgi:hypothetical protein
MMIAESNKKSRLTFNDQMLNLYLQQGNANNKLHQTNQFITEINMSFKTKDGRFSQTYYARSGSVIVI